MFDDHFVSFQLLAQMFWDSLLKLLSSSAEDSFDKRYVPSNKEVLFNDFPS